MKNTKKLFVLLLATMISVTFLTGCGRPKGVYKQTSGYGGATLTFDGDHLTINALGLVELSGTYKIKGNQLLFTYLSFGTETTDTYSYSREGNSITLNGDTYTKSGSDDSVIWDFVKRLAIVAAGVAAVGWIGNAVIKRTRTQGARVRFRRPTNEEVHETLYRTSQTLASSAVEVGSRVAETTKKLSSTVSAGVSAGISAGKAAAQEKRNRTQAQRKSQISYPEAEEWEEVKALPEPDDVWEEAGKEYEEWEEVGDTDDEWEEVPADDIRPSAAKIASAFRTNAANTGRLVKRQAVEVPKPIPKREIRSKIRIDSEHCCICGKKLDDGSTRLNGLQSGREAWLDSQCLNKLQIMAQSSNTTEFEEAARYMKSRISFIDPDVGNSLLKFIRKSENRIYGEILK